MSLCSWSWYGPSGHETIRGRLRAGAADRGGVPAAQRVGDHAAYVPNYHNYLAFYAELIMLLGWQAAAQAVWRTKFFFKFSGWWGCFPSEGSGTFLLGLPRSRLGLTPFRFRGVFGEGFGCVFLGERIPSVLGNILLRPPGEDVKISQDGEVPGTERTPNKLSTNQVDALQSRPTTNLK